MALWKQEFHYDPSHLGQQAQVPRQVTVEISDELYNEMLVEANQHNQSLGQYLGELLEQRSLANTGGKPLTPKVLRQVQEVRRKIMQDTNNHQFEDSTEVIRQMRIERSEELEQR